MARDVHIRSRGNALRGVLAIGCVGAVGMAGAFGAIAACDGSHFDEERIAAPASHDERGGEIVAHGDPAEDERQIAQLCPHGHVKGAPRTIEVAVQIVPHPIGESSPVAGDRIPIVERRIPFTCALPPVAIVDAAASSPIDAGDARETPADAASIDGAPAAVSM